MRRRDRWIFVGIALVVSLYSFGIVVESNAGQATRLPVGTGGQFGTAHPAVVHSADQSERWIALCQARADTNHDGMIGFSYLQHGELMGDRPRLYLVIGGGRGTLIDALPGVSADGRWLAIVRKSRLELADGETGVLFALPRADAQGDGRPGAPHRAARFAGNALLYIRRGATQDALVIHDVGTHVEREVAVAERLWRISADSDRYVRVYTIPRGKAWPRLSSNLSGGECTRAASYSTYGQSGPEPNVKWIDLEKGAELAVDGKLVAIIGSTLVRAAANGALYFNSDEIAPAGCDPLVLDLMAAPPRVVVQCRKANPQRMLLLGKALRVDLGPFDGSPENDPDPPTLSAMEPNPEIACQWACVQTATNRIFALDGGWPCAIWKAKIYICKHEYDYSALKQKSLRSEILDTATGERTAIYALGKRQQAGRFVLDLDNQLVDLEQAQIIGKAPGALLINRKGNVLRSRDGCDRGADCGYVRLGPLRWSSP